MKLLFDQNLSHRLIDLLKEVYPGSIHVKDIAMQEASDTQIWEYAKQKNFTIVSKDSDFHQRSFVFGHPPKVVWIDKGNCTTKEISKILKRNHQVIKTFIDSRDSSFLVLQ